MNKTIKAATVVGCLLAAHALIAVAAPAVSGADDPCGQRPGAHLADECEIMVDYYSYDLCEAGAQKDMNESDYAGYRYYDCTQQANGSWHVIFHNG